ncbi:MobF family relaxase [Erwinia sp. V71]|uniref:MobF family relaxase n=1 Tax=Erwinia sp. V71 TaxID=3369424 RepID=UPI003F5E4366
MMTPAPVASAGSAAEYYSSKDNYYFLGNLESQWLGEGAKTLGLTGPVDLDTFTDLLYGRLPDGTALGKDVQGNHVHRPGHDLTFSAPKSVSLLILAGGDRRLLDAHNESVKETLAIIEQMASARHTRDGVTSIVPTGKLVAALFTHDTSRNLEPQIHTHAIIANATELDGEWKALSSDTVHGAGFIEAIYRHQVSFGKIYRNRLEGRVNALGYETEKTGGPHGLWEIAGVPRDVLDNFSSRHAEIMGAAGPDASLKSRDVAALDTRQSKRAPAYYDTEKPVVLRPSREPQAEKGISVPEPVRNGEEPDHSATREPAGVPHRPVAEGHTQEKTVEQEKTVAEEPVTKPETAQGRERLLDGWRTQCDALGFDPQGFVAQAEAVPRPETEPAVTPDAMRAVRDAVSLLSDSRTRFTFGDLLLAAHEAGEQAQDIRALRPAIDTAIQDGLLVPLDREKGVFTSQIHLLDELSVQALAADHLKAGRVVHFSTPGEVPPAHLERIRDLPVAILNAPAAVPRLREAAEELVTMSRDLGRPVRVLASSAERAVTLGKSASLQDLIVPRSQVLSAGFSLEPHSTLVVEGAERLGLKEMLVLPFRIGR